jgi:hypothetical protein
MGFSVDKRLKIDKPFGTVYSSTEPCLIKIGTTAPCGNLKADYRRALFEVISIANL